MIGRVSPALELAELIETRVAAIEAEHPLMLEGVYQHGAWPRRDEATRKLIGELERDWGARYRHRPPDGHHFKLAGIGNSCTSGALAMLSAWVRKARRSGA